MDYILLTTGARYGSNIFGTTNKDMPYARPMDLKGWMDPPFWVLKNRPFCWEVIMMTFRPCVSGGIQHMFSPSGSIFWWRRGNSKRFGWNWPPASLNRTSEQCENGCKGVRPNVAYYSRTQFWAVQLFCHGRLWTPPPAPQAALDFCFQSNHRTNMIRHARASHTRGEGAIIHFFCSHAKACMHACKDQDSCPGDGKLIYLSTVCMCAGEMFLALKRRIGFWCTHGRVKNRHSHLHPKKSANCCGSGREYALSHAA
jgi:hypothetical protein